MKKRWAPGQEIRVSRNYGLEKGPGVQEGMWSEEALAVVGSEVSWSCWLWLG